MRKLYTIVLTLALALALLAGCGGAPAEPEAETEAEATEAPSAEPTATPEPTEEPTPEEWVVADTEDVTFTITSFEADEEHGEYLWTVHLANKTDGKVMFLMQDAALDGMACDPGWGMALEAGEETDTTICFDAPTLAAAGLDGLTDAATAAFDLLAYDAGEAEMRSYIDERYTVAFQPGDAPVAYEPQEGDILVLDNDALQMVVTGFDPDAEAGYEMQAMVTNKAEYPLRIVVADAVIGERTFTSATLDKRIPAGAAAPVSLVWTFDYGVLGKEGMLDASGDLRTDLPITLNMTVTNEDDITAEPILQEGVTVQREG